MMGLTVVQQNCFDFLRSYRDERGVMPSFREVGDHLGIKSMSRVHYLMVALEGRGVIRRIAAKARAIEIVEPSSMQAVLLHSDTYRIAQLYAGSKHVSVDTAVNAIIRERLGAAA
jgi:SOS-response transcriptional repressor LexA